MPVGTRTPVAGVLLILVRFVPREVLFRTRSASVPLLLTNMSTDRAFGLSAELALSHLKGGQTELFPQAQCIGEAGTVLQVYLHSVGFAVTGAG